MDDTSQAARIAARPEYAYGRSYTWYVLAILLTAYIFSFIDRQILGLLVEPIKADLGVSDLQISLLQGLAFALFYSILGVPIGRLADTRSRRVVMGIGIAIWSFMTAISGLARNFTQLFLARMGVGVGEAALSPAAYSMLADYFPKQHLNRAISIYAMGTTLGSGLAYLIGGAIIAWVASAGEINLPAIGDVAGWQLAFFVVGLPGLVIAVLLRTIKEPKRLGLIQAEAAPGSPEATPQELPISAAFDYIRTHARTYLTIFGGVSMISLLGYSVGMWWPSFFVRTYGWSVSQVGFAMGIIMLTAGTSGLFLGGWLGDRWTARGDKLANLKMPLISAVFAGPATLAATLSPTAEWALFFSVPSNFFLHFYLGCAIAALQKVTPNQLRAQVSALFLLCTNLVGLALGPFIVAFFTDVVFGDEAYLRYSLAVLAVVTTPVAIVLFWTGRPAYLKTLKATEVWG